MKPPPFLLGAALLFWGWQTGFLLAGAIMAVALESARWVKSRWDLSDDDFRRIWTFCGVLLLAAGVYALTSNDTASEVRHFFRDPSVLSERNVGNATSKAAAAWLRWLPMIFFLFILAQQFSPRQGIPLEVISLILRRRWKKARRLGRPVPASRTVSVSYPYFGVCLFASCIHANPEARFFWGLCGLLGWALWTQRPKRFAVAVWAATLVTAVLLGYAGQRALGGLARYLDNVNWQFNSQLFDLFRSGGFSPNESKTALGQLGRIKASGKIIVRVETDGSSPPNLLRAASYRTYSGQTWLSDLQAEEPQTVLQAPIDSYVLLPAKSNTATVNIACYLNGQKGLLPAPAGSGRLDNLFLTSLQKTSLGVLLAEGPGLAVFNARYGPGAIIDSPGNTNQDLAVPAREAPALDQVISELHLQGQSLEQTLRTLNKFFLDEFSYTIWQGLRPRASTNETPLGYFLLRSRSGHCEYFATATVLLLRRLGIPARYAVGYSVHEGTGEKYVVRERDAHAWCLAWNQQTKKWRDVDTTPASWVETEGKRASPFQSLSDCWSRVVFELSRLRWGQSDLRQYVLWALGPILALLLYQIIFRSRRRRQRMTPSGGDRAIVWPGLDSEFYEVEQGLEKRGAARRPGEPLSEWLRRAAAEPDLLEMKEPLQRLLRLHYRYRFDPPGLSPADREALRHETRACLDNLKTRGAQSSSSDATKI